MMQRHGGMRITTLAVTIGAAGLWLLVGALWGIWVNPLTLFSMPEVAFWSLIVLGIWNTTITQLLWLGGLAGPTCALAVNYSVPVEVEDVVAEVEEFEDHEEEREECE